MKNPEGNQGIRVATAEFTAGAALKEQIPAPSHFGDAPEIAFAGRSNVGKSSLLNMVLARNKLARTSNTPGRTRQINFFDIGLVPDPKIPDMPKRIVFVDLPGYGYAKVSKTEAHSWKDLLEGYLTARTTLKAVVILVDIRRGLEGEEMDLVDFLGQRPEITVFVAVTKMDKLSGAQRKPALAALIKASPRPLPVIGTSAETGDGRDALWGRILNACTMST